MDKASPITQDDYIICRSKSRPDRFYKFNKKTCETEWCTGPVDKTKPVKTINVKCPRTPAQDRLKRLQNNLQKKGINDGATERGKIIRQSRSINISPTKPKSVQRPCQSSEGEQTANVADSTNNYRPHPSCSKKQRAVPKVPSPEKSNSEEQPVFYPVLRTSSEKHSRQREENSSSKQNNPTQQDKNRLPVTKSTLACPLTNIKDIIKDKNSNDQPSELSAECDSKDKSNKAGFIYQLKRLFNHISDKVKITSQEKSKKSRKSKKTSLSGVSKVSVKPNAVIKTSKALVRGLLEKDDNENVKFLSQSKTAKLPSTTSLLLPPVPNENANARLQRLRQSLQLQIRSQQVADIPIATESSSSKSNTLESEPMDWQPISEEDTSTGTKETPSPVPTSPNTPEDYSRSDNSSKYLDRVNKNLLRLTAAKCKTQTWKTDHFYFVVDTNVFINCLSFVEELTKMKLCDTRGTLIYVPYCVLQELDKLKMRNSSESIKIRASRAIRYLNKTFEDNNPSICAQSGSDESNHIITVTSPDDSILNCCLQVKQHVDNVLLLTEDINLQNKAICNNIMVSSKSDLVSVSCNGD